ncbi:uncharacterized protein LOC120208169 [Hibiscus syriacus]|uniref:uncharacterized protein LOC120208169 n=1 Tax=Hibiscus syriacus TaxID=106335 RepID=UPI001924FCC6|nr:uncharacterized protein LOC120208169 [Hibiscus syriacus]
MSIEAVSTLWEESYHSMSSGIRSMFQMWGHWTFYLGLSIDDQIACTNRGSAMVPQRGRGRGQGRNQSKLSTQYEIRSTARVYNIKNNEDRNDPEIIAKFAYNNSYHSSNKMAPYEALYRRKCRTPLNWYELKDRNVLGPDLIKEKVLRFGRKGKLSTRFIGPYNIVKRVGLVAYQLALPPEMENIHNAFHVSMLRRYHSDASHIITPEEINIQPDLTYKEEPVKILGHGVKELRNKKISLVKVLWRNHKVKEETWELEDYMRRQFPHLFVL